MPRPSKCITVAEAQTLQDNWITTRALYIKNAMGSEDTRDFTFSLEELQAFIDYVREQSEDQGIVAPGIRIFFAAYDNEKSDKATVFLGATDGINPDSPDNLNIDPLNSTTGGWPPNSY